MRKLVLLFAALLVAGCGEKSSSEGSAKPSLAGTLFALEPQSEVISDTPNSLSDADVERLLKEAVDEESLEGRDGQPDGPYIEWYQNGQKWGEVTFKDGKPDGPWPTWHENGQKQAEVTFKDGEQVSAKYWNRKGEEVATEEESEK